jgi:hypothetical protein
MTPHLEAAREKVVTEYVPQARKAGRRARKQVLEEYVPQARAALDDARDAAGQAVNAAAVKAGRKPEPKRRGRTLLKLAVLAGIGTAIGQALRKRNVSPVSMYEAPQPTTAPPEPTPPADVDPVPPGAVGEHHPDPEDVERLEGEAPLPPAPTGEIPDDSLNSFFDEVLDETRKGSRRR